MPIAPSSAFYQINEVSHAGGESEVVEANEATVDDVRLALQAAPVAGKQGDRIFGKSENSAFEDPERREAVVQAQGQEAEGPGQGGQPSDSDRVLLRLQQGWAYSIEYAALL